MIGGGFITFTRDTRKGKTGTQQIEIIPALQHFLDEWSNKPTAGYLFPSRRGSQQAFMSRVAADNVLKAACARVGIDGVSTHSFRRTYITLRTRIKRLARKTICFSKSILMHDGGIGLFIKSLRVWTISLSCQQHI